MNRKADFLLNESIRIHSHNESNRIDSNRELECSSDDVAPSPRVGAPAGVKYEASSTAANALCHHWWLTSFALGLAACGASAIGSIAAAYEHFEALAVILSFIRATLC